MSLFGKILAVLNIFGALGMVCLGAMDYSVRRAWAYSIFRHDLAINGLPLDRQQRTDQGRVMADQIGEQVLTDLFNPVGGSGAATQVDEVQRVKNLLRGQIDNGTTAQKLKNAAYVLLPLARNEVDREKLLVCRNEMTDDAAVARFKKRLQTAYVQALVPPKEKGPAKTFDERFRQRLHEDGGGPAEPFVAEIVARATEDPKLLDDPKAAAEKFDAFFDQAIESQRDLLMTRFDEVFDEALHGPKKIGDSPLPPTPQEVLTIRRVAIARLLFNLTPTLAQINLSSPGASEADLKKVKVGPVNSSVYLDAVLDTDAYQKALLRLEVVVGLEALVGALNEQLVLVQEMDAELAKVLTEDKLEFVAQHRALLEAIVNKASEVESDIAMLERKKEELGKLERIVAERTLNVTKAQEELAASRLATAKEVEKLKTMTQKLYDLRIVLRDTRVKNLQGEKQIRELEQRVRDLETR